MIPCVLVCFHTTRMAVTAVHFWHGVFVNSGESLQKINGRAPKVYAACIMLLISQAKGWRKENMFTQINNFITWFDGVVWGLPLIILILITGLHFNRSVRLFTGKTSWKSTEIHGKK